MHPSEEIKFEKSRKLEGKKVCLCITGSAACAEAFYLCRELIRHGADVDVFMTPEATRLIHPNLMEFASGKKPVVELSGDAEHVSLCGRGCCDAVVVCPCTANTISKVALGIADNAVTSCVLTAIGSKLPVIIVPAMHLSLMKNDPVERNIERLKEMGCTIVEPRIEGERAKIADRETIIENIIRCLRKRDLEGKKILIIGGASAERIDDIRVLTNRSSGKFAVELVRECFERGAYVEFWHGWVREKVPDYVRSREFESVEDLLKMINDCKDFDFIFVCAALSNYIPEPMYGKIPSSIGGLTLDLKVAPRLIDKLKEVVGGERIIAFKAEEREEDLIKKAREMSKVFYMIVGNLTSSFGSDRTKIWIFRDGNVIEKEDKKDKLAELIVDKLG